MVPSTFLRLQVAMSTKENNSLTSTVRDGENLGSQGARDVENGPFEDSHVGVDSVAANRVDDGSRDDGSEAP